MGEDTMQGMQNSGDSRKPALDRVPTGIGGLDGMIEGGLPVSSIILISGLLNLAKVIKEQSTVALIIGEPSSGNPYSADIAYISSKGLAIYPGL